MVGPVLHRQLKKPLEAYGTVGAKICVEHKGRDLALWDLSSGAGVTCLGHSCAPIKEAMVAQIEHCPYLHSGAATAFVVEECAQRLLDLLGAPYQGGAVMFLNTGAEALEAACKLSIQYFAERGQMEPSFWAREHSYHGNTFWTLALGDHPRRHAYQAYLPEQSIERLPLDELGDLRHILTGEPFVVVVEPVAGTTAGIQVPPRDYLMELHDVCRANNGLLIYDEVLGGNYRFGHMFAHQRFKSFDDNSADIVCIGKGLTGGYFPLSAVIASKRVMDAIEAGSGKLWHSTTNQNHPIGCAAGVAALGEYERCAEQRENLQYVLSREMPKLAQYPAVESIGGGGTLYGVKLRVPQETFRAKAIEHSLLLYGDSQVNMVLIAPPYCMSREDLSECMAAFTACLLTCEQEVA